MKCTDKKSITVFLKLVGTICNMECKYCYEHVSKNPKRGIRDVQEVFDYLKEFIGYEHVFIVFHGGEPLLMKIHDIKNILDYIFINFKNKIHVQFQTNGTLLNDNWILLLKEYSSNISLSISLDPVGEKDLRYLNNKDYRKVVIDNLKKYSSVIKNIGIISVAHVYNKDYFINYIEELIKLGVSSITINKYRTIKEKDKYSITEMEYVILLKKIFMNWIEKKWYLKINIQPLLSLFSNNTNKICIYLKDENKCSYFRTFYHEKDSSNYCDHILDNVLPKVSKSCLECDIYSKCGGGCLMEEKEVSFCEGRRELFKFIEEMKNEN